MNKWAASHCRFGQVAHEVPRVFSSGADVFDCNAVPLTPMIVAHEPLDLPEPLFLEGNALDLGQKSTPLISTDTVERTSGHVDEDGATLWQPVSTSFFTRRGSSRAHRVLVLGSNTSVGNQVVRQLLLDSHHVRVLASEHSTEASQRQLYNYLEDAPHTCSLAMWHGTELPRALSMCQHAVLVVPVDELMETAVGDDLPSYKLIRDFLTDIQRAGTIPDGVLLLLDASEAAGKSQESHGAFGEIRLRAQKLFSEARIPLVVIHHRTADSIFSITEANGADFTSPVMPASAGCSSVFVKRSARNTFEADGDSSTQPLRCQPLKAQPSFSGDDATHDYKLPPIYSTVGLSQSEPSSPATEMPWVSAASQWLQDILLTATGGKWRQTASPTRDSMSTAMSKEASSTQRDGLDSLLRFPSVAQTSRMASNKWTPPARRKLAGSSFSSLLINLGYSNG